MDESVERLQAIQEKWRKKYDETIPAKLQLLEDFVSKMKRGIDQDTLKAFRIEIHKMAGSAGTVGYMNVSVIAKEFDQFLQEKLENFPPDPSFVIDCEKYLSIIKEGFSVKDN